MSNIDPLQLQSLSSQDTPSESRWRELVGEISTLRRHFYGSKCRHRRIFSPIAHKRRRSTSLRVSVLRPGMTFLYILSVKVVRRSILRNWTICKTRISRADIESVYGDCVLWKSLSRVDEAWETCNVQFRTLNLGTDVRRPHEPHRYLI